MEGRATVKDVGVQVAFFLILVGKAQVERDASCTSITVWYCRLCFGFYDRVILFKGQELLDSVGILLTKSGENIFKNKLAYKLRKVLN